MQVRRRITQRKAVAKTMTNPTKGCVHNFFEAETSPCPPPSALDHLSSLLFKDVLEVVEKEDEDEEDEEENEEEVEVEEESGREEDCHGCDDDSSAALDVLSSSEETK